MGRTFIFAGNAAVGSAISPNLVKAGYTAAGGVPDADVILIYCETQGNLEDMLFDEDGLMQSAKKGAWLVVLNASTPDFARELSAIAIVNDLHSAEAPLVINDVTRADAFSDPANLSCFLAGEAEDCEDIEPLIGAIVGTVEVTGAPGSAQAARAAMTIQLAARLVACMEAEALCRVSSLSSASLFDFSLDQGFITEKASRLLEAVREERFEGAYTVQMCMAEVTAALMTADDADLILPGAEACMHLLELLALIGGGEMAPAALDLVYGDEALCAKHGLDWAQAEQTWSEEGRDSLDDDKPCSRRDEFSGGFGGYSSN
ncbi:MAG: hypothetical protein LBB46_03120 [Coriobacteriaceae bacterium]|jgi:3-hydroxyisobutyrate dehydrogenase|nr:hypothetical protein [Coriobacteriaceae bacterium]